MKAKTKQSISEIKVKDIMTKHVEKLSPDDTIKDAASLMLDSKLTTVPIVNGDNQCVGILSRSDLTEMFLQEDSELSNALDNDRLSLEWINRSLDTSDVRRVKELMTYEVATVGADKSIVTACQEMARLKVHHLPVVDERQMVVGIVSAFDVVIAVAEAQI